jgi:hypothetical protein
MAVGDKVTIAPTSLAQNAVLNIRPSSGQEWTIHNIIYDAGSIELRKTDGTNSLKYETDTTAGGRFNITLHCTNAVWYQIKNTSASAVLASYDGVQTK